MECVLITKMPELNAMLTYNSAKSGHLHTTNAKKIETPLSLKSGTLKKNKRSVISLCQNIWHSLDQYV